MEIKIKCNKATVLKIAGIALGLAGTLIDREERKMEIEDAVSDYLKEHPEVINRAV